MTNDQRLDGFHNYRFEMYCADQAEITSLRTQLAEVARERDLLRAALIECAVPLEVLHAIDCGLAPATQAGITAAIAAIGLNKWGKPHKLRMAELGDDMPPKNIYIPGDNPNEVPW